MQIKTIREQNILSESFDDMVNEALAEGWQLTRRTVINGKLYAELVMPDEPQPRAPIDWRDAVETLRELCESQGTCVDCPAVKWCETSFPTNREGMQPHGWEVPEE